MTGLSQSMFKLHEPDVVALKEQLLREGKKTPEEVDKLPFSYWKKK